LVDRPHFIRCLTLCSPYQNCEVPFHFELKKFPSGMYSASSSCSQKCHYPLLQFSKSTSQASTHS
jgi:hypothetical protein